jgi:hypothetical protein
MRKARRPTKKEMLQLIQYVQQIRGWHFMLAEYDTALWFVMVYEAYYMCGHRGKTMIAIDTEFGRLHLFAWDKKRGMYPLRDAHGGSIRHAGFRDYKDIGGITKLPTLNGYTIDTQLREFRGERCGGQLERIPFESESGEDMVYQVLYLARPDSRLWNEIISAP